jgi:hypothetical protein
MLRIARSKSTSPRRGEVATTPARTDSIKGHPATVRDSPVRQPRQQQRKRQIANRTGARILATAFARGLQKIGPLEKWRAQAIPRGTQGRPGARCTRGLACKDREKGAHEHTGSAEAVRPSLRNGFTAYNVLSPVTGLLSPSPARLFLANLTPASGRQDHTTSPSASALFVKSASASTASHPDVRDDGQRPLVRDETPGISR